jgi:hypothetical protein
MGILNIRGMVLTGIEGKSLSQEGATNLGGTETVDGNWRVGVKNPVWGENRFDLHLDYSFLNYGAFMTLRWQSWAANSFDPDVMPDARYVFVYGKFVQDRLKVSLGKLTDDIYAIPETRVFKTEGPWDMFNFTEDAKDNEHMSMRIEFKPIPQLNLGVQYFFVNPEGDDLWGDYWQTDFAESEVWKEIGLAAEWKSDLFNAVAGIRFDSKGDPLNKYEFYIPSPLRGYYGNSDYLGTQQVAAFFGPRFKHAAEVIDQPQYNSDYAVTGYTAAPGYDGASRAFFGFNIKAVKNMDIIAQAGFYNIGAWEKFGYARTNELVRYNNLGVKGLGLGLIMSQEFFGSDVFTDDVINTPFLTFSPELSYALVDVPGFQLKGTLTGTYGVSVDVLDTYVKVKPNIGLLLGALILDLFYEVEYVNYTDKALDRSMGGPASPVNDETRHIIGLAAMMIF